MGGQNKGAKVIGKVKVPKIGAKTKAGNAKPKVNQPPPKGNGGSPSKSKSPQKRNVEIRETEDFICTGCAKGFTTLGLFINHKELECKGKVKMEKEGRKGKERVEEEVEKVTEDDKGQKGKEPEEKGYMDPWFNPPNYVIDGGAYEVGESSNASASRERRGGKGKGEKNKGKGKGKF